MTVNFLFIHINEWAPEESPDAVPVSQGYILAYLQQHGFAGKILGDYKDKPLSADLFRDTLTGIRPKVLGFSVYDENISRVRLWASFAKTIDPDLLIVLGGPQITFMPAEGLRQMPEADILCRGEGETVMLALARVLEEGGSLQDIPGICFIDKDETIENVLVPGPLELDALPSPYLDGVVDPIGKSRVILLSSRGCASPCSFCYTTRASNKKVRFHSIGRIIAEMRFLKAKGIFDFWFADPNFAFSRQRLEELLQAIIAQVPGATFWCQTRYDLVDSELLTLLKKAGAQTIAFGLESADQTVLKSIKKGLDLERMSLAIRQTQAAGIAVELFTLFGLPGETFAQALETLDFVRRHNVAIDGNSISQQLHIFFGIPLNDDHASHGITPLPITKPAYLSVCRDFETLAMSEAEIRTMSQLWRLNRHDFADDVESSRNLFNVAGFITANYENISCQPKADMMLAKICLELDEFAKAAECLARLTGKFGDRLAIKEFVAGPFTAYKTKRRGVAAFGCKIIYDCKGTLDNAVVPATVGYYQTGVLGAGTLLADFEKGVMGLKAGGWNQFDAVFPENYGNRELAGKKIVFQVYLHQVLEPVVIDSLQQMTENPPRNIYRFHDLPALREWNEKLYYLALRDAALQSLTGDPADILALMNFYLRLGFVEKAEELTAIMPRDPAMMGHVGRIYLANKQFAKALEFLDQAGSDAEVDNNRIKALIETGRLEEAEKIAAAPRLSNNSQTLDLRVGLASLRRLPVSVYLERMDDLLQCRIRDMQGG